jgi:hypothetical protein
MTGGMVLKRRLNLIWLSLLIALTAFALSDVMADNSRTNWDGTYNTNVKDGGAQRVWESPSTLLVAWGKEVQYGGTPISKAEFFNNSSIAWTGDSNWGNGQIWFTTGDNRSLYWPDGAVKGRVFVGWIQEGTAAPSDFRGLNGTIPLEEQNRCNGSCPDQTIICKSCSNGKVCISGQCVCPSGTNDCNGQCLVQTPCGGCENGKICSKGQCICPVGTKGCNDQCIKVAECCDGCPTWKVCSNGKCVCPPGVKDCPDPLPL